MAFERPKPVDLVYRDEAYKIYGAAIEVHKQLGPGFAESVYQEALEREFVLRDIPYKREQLIHIMYKGQPLKSYYRADFMCYGKIIVELKALKTLESVHIAQVLNYLKATNFRLGLLINFGSHPKLERERILNKYYLPPERQLAST